jgi:hypothetical protein
MDPSEESILAVADIVLDSVAMGDAALAGDFDEARFRSQLVVAKADAAGHLDVVLAAAHTLNCLGPVGTVPRDGYGAGMLRVASELEKIGFQPV